MYKVVMICSACRGRGCGFCRGGLVSWHSMRYKADQIIEEKEPKIIQGKKASGGIR